MNYLQALKTARDHFGHDAFAVEGGSISPISELIEQAETAPTVAGSSNVEVRVRTDAEVITSSGTRVPAWAVHDELPPGEGNGEDEEEEPLLWVISGEDLHR